MLTKELGNVEQSAGAHWRDYYALTKPGVVQLLVFTAIVGMFLATPGMVPWDALIAGSLGIGLAAAAGAVVNQILDQRIDAQMARTRNRPLPQGRISERDALAFAMGLGLAGLLGARGVRQRADGGADVPVADRLCRRLHRLLEARDAAEHRDRRRRRRGAARARLDGRHERVDPHALLLFLIIFTWTPPHFWALAIARRSDYERADIPMLPVTHGDELTKSFVVYYTILLILVTVLPYITGMTGLFYTVRRAAARRRVPVLRAAAQVRAAAGLADDDVPLFDLRT